MAPEAVHMAQKQATVREMDRVGMGTGSAHGETAFMETFFLR